MSQGYIKLHRQLQDCWVWQGERFSRGQAWVDLLMMANHKDVKIPFGEKIEVIKRGQFITSIAKLAEKWQWSFNTVKKFLNLLENDNMLIRKSDNTKTLITIVNYDIYQYSETEKEGDLDRPIDRPVDRPIDRPIDGQSADLLTDPLIPNKNDKNVKNEKNVKNVFRKPSLEEVKAYIEEKGYSIDAERFINYYESNGWMVGRNKMKNWKAAVSNWASKDKPKTNTSYDDAVKAFLESED